MVSATKKYVVGQKLWWVPPHSQYDRYGRNGGHEVTVTKVGVKYVTVSWAFEESRWPMERVFNKVDGYEKGDMGNHHRCGRAWLTRDDYDRNVKSTAAWCSLCDLAARKLQRHRSPPVDLTMYEIEIITGLLESIP